MIALLTNFMLPLVDKPVRATNQQRDVTLASAAAAATAGGVTPLTPQQRARIARNRATAQARRVERVSS